MSNLLIIVPSRGRPQSIKELYQAFVDTDSMADLLVAVDEDDPALEGYKSVTQGLNIRLRVGPRKRLGPTLNDVALEEKDNYPFIGFMGDDHRPRTKNWDWSYESSLDKHVFVYGDDLLQGRNLPTQVAMRSSVVTALGYMCPPELIHMFLDNAWKTWGDMINSIEYLPDVIVEHLHPAAGKASEDAGYTEVWGLMDGDSAKWNSYISSGWLDSDVEKLRSIL